MPKISFILPAYKRRFLKEAVKSILAQTCRDFELVIVDDASPERLLEEIHEELGMKEWQDNPSSFENTVDGIRVRYYRNEQNLGGKDLVAAWEKAMEYAEGEWCVLAADDDLYDSHYLEEMVALTCKYPQADLHHCRLAAIDDLGRWTGVSQPRLEYESQMQMVYYRGGVWYFQVAPDFMFRLSALRAIGGFVKFPHAWYTDDATWMVLAKNGVGCSSKVLFMHRGFSESVSCRDDNVWGKCKASEMFKRWFEKFLSTLRPETVEERLLYVGLLQKAIARADNLTIRSLQNVPLKEFMKFVNNKDYDRMLRHGAFWARFPRLLALRRMLP